MKKSILQKNEVHSVSKYVRMSPSKVRRVLRQIQGKKYPEALLLLEFMPYASCAPIIKVLRSAAANAKK
jgi:large subunit ribosomal protein L22